MLTLLSWVRKAAVSLWCRWKEIAMFRKLKIRFILLASAAIVCILLTMIAVLNSVRFLQTNGEIQAVLNILSANNGDFPSVEETAESLQNDRITIYTIYQYRYFSVVYKEDKTLYSTNLDHLSNLSKEQALSYANKVIKDSRSSGVFKVGSQFYSYQITQDSKTKRYLLVVLDLSLIHI